MYRYLGLSFCFLLMICGLKFPVLADPIPKYSETETIWLEPPQKGCPQKRGDRFYEVKYTQGQIRCLKQAPPTTQGIVAVRLHINDYNGSSSGTPWATIKRYSDLIVSFIYPTFWSGKAWLPEAELKKQAPQVYKKLMTQVMLEHSTIVHSTNQLQQKSERLKRWAQIQYLKLDVQMAQNPEHKQKLRRELQQRLNALKSYEEMMERLKKQGELGKVSKIYPQSLVRGQRFEISIAALEKRLFKEQDELQTFKAKQGNRLTPRQKIDFEVASLKVQNLVMCLDELKQKQQIFEKKNWRLTFSQGSWHY